ncbi:hypothetical protein BKA70DRAFT_1447537 [Coprinopsis sp. MPI-PUGE-AT-0042]|nr:hypothetical protein BKA70DRAFT_1447537 [Coprinopsis sp. MPI-PUGE-AT-0042]
MLTVSKVWRFPSFLLLVAPLNLVHLALNEQASMLDLLSNVGLRPKAQAPSIASRYHSSAMKTLRSLRRRFYVVVSGKVVGVFVDREFAVKVQSSELARYKFKTLLDALEFYNKKKAEGSLRIMRRSRDDEAIYGPLDEAIM